MKMYKNISTFIIIALILPVFTYGNNNMNQGIIVGGTMMSAEDTIIENISKSSEHTTLTQVIESVYLDKILSEDGPYTLFGPSNYSFQNIEKSELDRLLMEENKDELQSILKYHIVFGEFTSADLIDGMMLNTIQGDVLKVNYKDSKWYINNSLIKTSDIESSNGVIHAIDQVLIPEPKYIQKIKQIYETRALLNDQSEKRADAILNRYYEVSSNYGEYNQDKMDAQITELLDRSIETVTDQNLLNTLMLIKLEIEVNSFREIFTEDEVIISGILMLPSNDIVENMWRSYIHRNLISYMKQTDILDDFKGTGNYTVFAPTNEAFKMLGEEQLDSFGYDSNKKEGANILKRHIVEGIYTTDDLEDGLILTTINGDILKFRLTDGNWYVNDILISIPDFRSTNGVIHSIDEVIL